MSPTRSLDPKVKCKKASRRSEKKNKNVGRKYVKDRNGLIRGSGS